MAFCEPGQHASLDTYEYEGTVWCRKHPPPPGPIDPPKPGICTLGRTHQADATFWVGVMGKRACRKHLAILLREVIRRSDYGHR